MYLKVQRQPICTLLAYSIKLLNYKLLTYVKYTRNEERRGKTQIKHNKIRGNWEMGRKEGRKHYTNSS